MTLATLPRIPSFLGMGKEYDVVKVLMTGKHTGYTIVRLLYRCQGTFATL